MPEYCFYQKDNQVTALKKTDSAGAAVLTTQGYEKQFEELSAADKKGALARFNDIRNEEQKTTHAFTTGAVFASLTVGLGAIAGWLFLK